MRASSNAVWNIVEALTTSLVLFVVYKVILSHLGVAAMGIWSLVVGATAIGRVADVGIASGLGRYVALCQSRGTPPSHALAYIETALVVNAALYACLAAVLFWPLWRALGLAASGEQLSAARALLPYAVAAFATQNLTAVTNAALIGQHRSGLKSRMAIVALVLQGGASLLLVRSHGLAGLAMAQIGQYVLTALCGWVLVHRVAGQRVRLPWRIDKTALKDLATFGLKLQGLTLASFLFEPATKFVLSATLGVSVLGLYELVSRGVLQVRALLIAPSQNLTPIFTHQLQTDGAVGDAYDRAFVLLAAGGTVAMAALALGAPVISLIWLHRIEPLFVALSFVVAAGWWFNIISVPGYYLGVASGRLRWNMLGGGLTAVLSPLVAYALAPIGALGAVGGVMLGVGAGAVLTAVINCRALGHSPVPPFSAWREMGMRLFQRAGATLT